MEVFPPVGQFHGQFAGVCAQAKKVVAGTEPHLPDQPGSATGRAPLEARLHQPNLAHVAAQFAAARDVADARVEHGIHGLLQCRRGRLASGLQRVPALQHVVPQQAGQHETGGHRAPFLHPAVGVLQGQAHELVARRIGRARSQHGVQHGKHAPLQTLLSQLFDAGQRMPGLQQLDHLVEQARRRHIRQQRRHRPDGLARGGLDLEAQLGSKPHHTDDAHRVFAIAPVGVADHAQQAGADVGDAAVVVDHGLRQGVVVHRVDREVAPRRVLDLRAPDVVAQHPAAGVHHVRLVGTALLAGLLDAGHAVDGGHVQVGAEGRDLDDFVFAPAAEHHVHQAKAPTDDERTPEQALDLLRGGVGGHVEVFGPQTHQQVAHGAAHHVGLEARVLQCLHHAHCVGVQQRQIDAVLGCGQLDARAQWHIGNFGLGRCGNVGNVGNVSNNGLVALAQQSVDECLDHENRVRIGQPRSRAMRSSAGPGLVATGSLTCSRSGRSLVESL